MRWRWSFYKMLYPEEPYAWAPVRILRETEKALLVFNGGRRWIPKSRIHGIRLRGLTIELRIRASWLA